MHFSPCRTPAAHQSHALPTQWTQSRPAARPMLCWNTVLELYLSCPQIDPGSPRRAPKTLEVKSGGSRAASLVGFLKSREGQLGILSMVMLIFQGTALSLTLRFSRCAKPPLAQQPPGCQRCSDAACCTVPPSHLLAGNSSVEE